MRNFQPRRSFSPTTRSSKSQSSSSLNLSRSSDLTSSRSRSPRLSRSSVQERHSRRRPVSRDRRGSPSQRRSVSPLSRRRRFSPRRSRSPAATSSSRRRSKSPYRRSQSPRTPTPRSGRRMSPPHSRGHQRTRSPPGERAHGRYISEGSDNAATRHTASSGRIRYHSQPGPMGRYNSRLGREWDGENTGQKREWTCNKCSEIFFNQSLYVEHVRERNLKMKCPGREELLVLDDSPPAPVKKEREPGNKRSAPPTEVILDDSPPYIAADLCVEVTTLPPSTADADSELPPIVPPPDQSSLCLEPVSDQSRPTSPVITSAPISLPVRPNFLPSDTTGSSPPRLPREMMQSRVKFREDGVLMFDEVTVQAKKTMKFKKNLFKVLADLLDIPDNTNNNTKNIEPVFQPIPAKVNAEEPTNMFPAACEGLVLSKSLNSANSLLESLPNQFHPISVVEGSEPRRKLPKCLREDDEIEEPALVSKVKASKPVDDEMEFLLDKRVRKQFIKKKAALKEDSPEITKKSIEGPNQCSARPCETSRKDSTMEPSDVVASLSKKKKKGMKRRLKEQMKKAVNVLTIPSGSSPLAESKPSQSELTSQDVASLRLVIHSFPVLEQAIPSPVSSCLLSESSLLPTSAPSVPSSSQLPPASVSESVTVLPASTLAIISKPVTTSLSQSISPSTSRAATSKCSTITTTSLLSTSSSLVYATHPMPTESMPTTSLVAELSPQPSIFGRSDSMATVSSGVFKVAWQLSSRPRVSPVSTAPSPPTPPTYGGEVMSLYQALGGCSSEDEEETPQPVIRAGVDCMDKCPDCKAKLETGSRALNFSLNMIDLSILVDCVQCGVRVRLKGVLGARQRAVLGCGM